MAKQNEQTDALVCDENEIKEGSAVKKSWSALRPMRDYWLSCGRAPQKTHAKDALELAGKLRGRVVAIVKNNYSTFARVEWDDGTQSDCLLYMIERVR